MHDVEDHVHHEDGQQVARHPGPLPVQKVHRQQDIQQDDHQAGNGGPGAGRRPAASGPKEADCGGELAPKVSEGGRVAEIIDMNDKDEDEEDVADDKEYPEGQVVGEVAEHLEDQGQPDDQEDDVRRLRNVGVAELIHLKMHQYI